MYLYNHPLFLDLKDSDWARVLKWDGARFSKFKRGLNGLELSGKEVLLITEFAASRCSINSKWWESEKEIEGKAVEVSIINLPVIKLKKQRLKLLKNELEQKGHSLESISKETGLNLFYIRDVFNGKHSISKRLLIYLVDSVGVSLGFLLGKSDNVFNS